MTNPQLLEYIKQQLALNVSREQIKANLMGQGGWTTSDIDGAFFELSTPGASGVVIQKQKINLFKVLGVLIWVVFLYAPVSVFLFNIETIEPEYAVQLLSQALFFLILGSFFFIGGSFSKELYKKCVGKGIKPLTPLTSFKPRLFNVLFTIIFTPASFFVVLIQSLAGFDQADTLEFFYTRWYELIVIPFHSLGLGPGVSYVISSSLISGYILASLLYFIYKKIQVINLLKNK